VQIQILSSLAPNAADLFFKPCITNTITISDTGCMGKICNMFFVRVGTDGWMPETATVFHSDYPPATFNFNYFIPEGVPSGINNC